MVKKRKNKGKSRGKKVGYFREGWKYLSESKNYVWAMVGLFVLSGIFGVVFFGQLGFIDTLLRDLISQIEGKNAFELILFILQNNAKSAFFALIFGVVFGIFPLFNAVFNGLILGYVLRGVYIISGVSDFWRLLPHGIFELPAIFISLGLGTKLGMFIFAKKKKKVFRERLIKSLIVYFTIVLPLLIVGAIIEGLLIFYLS